MPLSISRSRLAVVAVSIAGLVGAAAAAVIHRPPPAPAVAAPPARASFHAVPLPPTLTPSPAHSVKAIMTDLVDPAADGIWNSVGSITSRGSEEQWAPSTDAEWQRLEGHAQAIVRGAAALSEPERAAGREDWLTQARALRSAGQGALDAARRRSVAALDEASEGLLDACQRCHAHYWLTVEAAR